MFTGLDLDQSAMVFANDMIERMAPRDPVEEALVVEMLMAHVRVLHLTYLANQQTDLDALRITNEYADRASNTYRRLVKAFDEHRRPPRSGSSFTAVQQANIAGHQVVVNNDSPHSE